MRKLPFHEPIGQPLTIKSSQSIARAVYAQKDTIILDDVFSGLDAHTENAVFHNLLGTDGILRRLKATVIVASSRCKC
jgi:ATP-binding cassette, subfamily C (CFTR/MRP), member 1